MTEKQALLLLNSVSGIGSIKLKQLLDEFGSAVAIFSATKSELRKINGISEKIATEILKYSFKNIEEELALAEKHSVEILTINDKDYPARLKEIPDAPIILYVKGKLLAQDEISIAIVGSRRASFYGLSTAEKFAQELSQLGITVVSGLARGIDSSAHRGALKSKARTIAVLGSGLAEIYPPENKKLFEEITESGAVVSEFPMKAKPLAHNFPRRNRIISGLSLGVIVVEAAKNSGALITADFALEQGREVFAIPGKVDSATSYGTNKLIKQGAKLISSVEDIIEELKPQLEIHLKEIKKSEFVMDKQLVLSEDESRLYDILSFQPKHIDEIVAESGFKINSVLGALMQMEIRHLVRQLPGKLFVRQNG
ncbi:MAG: DNA-protecting protein DprA [Candidatus Omnitrophica bacterium]|nr:DNA-protecting protein DprA [Candidatus Omnitrophota bacterium]